MRRAARVWSSCLAVVWVLIAGCAADATSSGTITVSAAASLTDAFGRIGADFEAANPGVEVSFNFDSSSTLARQIIDGAPADVFAAADEVSMAELTDAGEVAGDAEVFARNELVIVTEPGNPTGITGLADLETAGVVALCGAEVPCGRSAAQSLAKAGVTIPESSVTRGQNVRATLTAVADGDAVAGIVYVTDALAVGDAVATVTIPAGVNVVATYPIGVVASRSHRVMATAFVAHVLGPDGQAVLKELGFLPPV
jgi:molybdate transport system substrate-binding protein